MATASYLPGSTNPKVALHSPRAEVVAVTGPRPKPLLRFTRDTSTSSTTVAPIAAVNVAGFDTSVQAPASAVLITPSDDEAQPPVPAPMA